MAEKIKSYYSKGYKFEVSLFKLVIWLILLTFIVINTVYAIIYTNNLKKWKEQGFITIYSGEQEFQMSTEEKLIYEDLIDGQYSIEGIKTKFRLMGEDDSISFDKVVKLANIIRIVLISLDVTFSITLLILIKRSIVKKGYR